jgi:hypothetical protein
MGRVAWPTELLSEKDYSKGLSITANIIIITGNAILIIDLFLTHI